MPDLVFVTLRVVRPDPRPGRCATPLPPAELERRILAHERRVAAEEAKQAEEARVARWRVRGSGPGEVAACDECGGEFWLPRWQMAKRRRAKRLYCSRACADKGFGQLRRT